MNVTATVYDPNQFMDWFSTSKPGDACEYYRGELYTKDKPAEVRALANRAWISACQGTVTLVQQREGYCDFRYIAVRLAKPPRVLPTMRHSDKPKLTVLAGQRY